ncbi:MAG: zf-TFIIB domain-containing protein [Planctomycetes bacterium]|nr:zf-TFIIB domain-containing protein [Planctomycetota bacterium]MCB9903837.1 zf-TFIIB domain-containing protein [Planctomycetota bacterium]
MPERVLNACPACARQYDVSHLAPGAAVRCDCGERFFASKPRPEALQATFCSGCGGAVPYLAPSCPYCNAEIAAEDRGLGLRCPHCFAKGRSGAGFCGACGGKLEPAARPAVPDGRRCPRCEGALRGENLAGILIIECTVCSGVWLTPGAFEQAIRTSQQAGPLPSSPEDGALGPLYEESEVRYLPCLGCDELMTRKRIAGRHGATVDVCRSHGLWFDAGELERILAWVRAGGTAHTPWQPRQAQLDPAEMMRSKALRLDLRSQRDEAWWHGAGRTGGFLGFLAALFFEE